MKSQFLSPKTAETQSSPSLLTRRQILRGSGVLCAAVMTPPALFAMDTPSAFDRRPAKSKRHFVSPAIESAIVDIRKRIADPQLAAIFENCLPNTLDTTVFPSTLNGRPDTFVVTGDIDAMWLRDSS